MSAKCQKQTSTRDVRFVPIADIPGYSISSSASVSNVGGISRSSVLAVLRLITNSNLVARSTGSSAGLAPLRIRPV